MARSPTLAICPSWITSPTRIRCPPAQSGKAFPNELQKGTADDLFLPGLSASMDVGTRYTGRTPLLCWRDQHFKPNFYHHFKQRLRDGVLLRAAGSGQSLKNQVLLLIATSLF